MTQSPQPKPLLTPAQVARLFGVGPKTVTRWARGKKINYIWTPGGHRRYYEEEVQAYLRGETPGGAK